MCVSVCIYIFKCVHMCVGVYVCAHVCYTYVFVCVHMCIYMCMYACFCVCIHVWECVYMFVHVCVCICVYTCVFTHVFMTELSAQTENKGTYWVPFFITLTLFPSDRGSCEPKTRLADHKSQRYTCLPHHISAFTRMWDYPQLWCGFMVLNSGPHASWASALSSGATYPELF